jgi:hypothetical protein
VNIVQYKEKVIVYSVSKRGVGTERETNKIKGGIVEEAGAIIADRAKL